MDEPSVKTRGVTLVHHAADQGLVVRGGLIPLSVAHTPARALISKPVWALMAWMLALLSAAGGVAAFYAPLWRGEVTLPPLVASLGIVATDFQVRDPFSERAVPPAYGPSLQYADTHYYIETRDALMAGGVSFIDLDLVGRTVRLFKDGVIVAQEPIERIPAQSSWCAVPAGLFKVEAVTADHYSSYLDAVLPFSVVFYGNRFIHGWPQHTDGSIVPDEYDRDCVRLTTDRAEILFKEVVPEMSVLVHAKAPEPIVTADFAARVPDFSTPYYLIADIDTDTVLAAGDRHEAVPIASVTKLMTALVVMDRLALDTMIDVEEPSLIDTLIPRLYDRSQVSVHTLLSLLLLESSNEAAEVLAGAVGREEFIAAMNERAAGLGMVDTVFSDPAGIESTNVSSVHDLWWLTRYLYQHYPFIIALTRGDAPTPTPVVDGYTALANFNVVNGELSFLGGKIGETEAAGQTSVTLHKRRINGVDRVIAVILLGSAARTDDVRRLLLYVDERFVQ